MQAVAAYTMYKFITKHAWLLNENLLPAKWQIEI
jgi:hypothetical protein